MGNSAFQQEFTNTFTALGERFVQLSASLPEDTIFRALNDNPWFTEENIRFALSSLGKMLNRESLEAWLNNYTVSETPKKIGLIMAGNIPLVGFHDLLCVLASGHKALIKTSSKDRTLMEMVLRHIDQINPLFSKRIEIRENLKDMDAVIATGSDNSARYFEHYFGKYPNIIRKNRTSVAIITGEETSEDFTALGKDIFTYFGLGCRNVSKLYVPENYNFTRFFEGIESYKNIASHHKYSNNYDFNKSVYLVNNEYHFDNGFLLLKNSDQIVSPVAVVYFENYTSPSHLADLLTRDSEKIQCIAEASPIEDRNSVPFGKAQQPDLTDYADNVDTMRFLIDLAF